MIEVRKCHVDTIVLSDKRSIFNFASCLSCTHMVLSLQSPWIHKESSVCLFSVMRMFLKGTGQILCRNVPPSGLVWHVFMIRFRPVFLAATSRRWRGVLLGALHQETWVGSLSHSVQGMPKLITWLSTWLLLLRVQRSMGVYWQLWQRPLWSPGADHFMQLWDSPLPGPTPTDPSDLRLKATSSGRPAQMPLLQSPSWHQWSP